jgi:hypothetical protein
MKTIIIFTFLFIALFSFSGCAVMGEVFVALILPPPPPPPDYNPEIIIIDQPSTPPSPYKRRETHTGRGTLDFNPAPTRNDENNKSIRDSGLQRGGHVDSNHAPARNDENNNGTRDSGVQRGRR